MSENIHQVYMTNPITTNHPTDLMYFGRSPYGAADDTAMLFSSFLSQLNIPVAFSWNEVVSVSQNMSSNNGYITNNSSQVSLLLPATSSVGQQIAISGLGSGGWIITQSAGQKIIIGSISSTIGAGGSVASTNRYDSVVFVCLQDNLTWGCLGAPQGNLNLT